MPPPRTRRTRRNQPRTPTQRRRISASAWCVTRSPCSAMGFACSGMARGATSPAAGRRPSARRRRGRRAPERDPSTAPARPPPTAGMVFPRLNVATTTTNDPLTEALPRLARGEIDAVFVVGADDSKALADFGKDGRFHVVAIPYAPALQALYCPMRLTSHDEPNLIGANDKIDTIGVPTALLAIDATPDSPRAARIATVAEHLFAQFDQSLGALPVSKWKEVNLAARIPGWPRFSAAEAWLEQNKRESNGALDAFRGAADTAAPANEVPAESDSVRLD